MSYYVSVDDAQEQFPDYAFIGALTPSAQKAAFHVQDNEGNNLCLKLINPNYTTDRLNREILALQSIRHPNVVRLKEYVFSSRNGDQKHYIVEEFIDGKDLSELLKPAKGWELKCVVPFFEALCQGLSALRQSDIVHRDLKPSNIRVRPDGSPVIIDFGLARHLGLPDLTVTAEGAAIGTPAYFAPEQFSGTKYDIDCRTDLFAVGVLMHQALLGYHPFFEAGMTLQRLRDAVCDSEEFRGHPSFANLPRPWRLLLGRLLEKDRVKRPQSAEQVAGILDRLRSV